MVMDIESLDEGDEEEESMQKDYQHSGKKSSADLEFEQVKEPTPVKRP